MRPISAMKCFLCIEPSSAHVRKNTPEIKITNEITNEHKRYFLVPALVCDACAAWWVLNVSDETCGYTCLFSGVPAPNRPLSVDQGG